MEKWRGLKRWQRWTIIGVGVFILLGIIGSLSSPDEDEKISASQAPATTLDTTTIPVTTQVTTTQLTTTSSAAAATTTTTRPPSTTAAPTTVATAAYPGKQKDDRLAAPDGSIQLSGYTTTVSDIGRSSDGLSRKLICATVSIRNRDTRTQRYSQFDFRLQTPGGEVKDSTLTLQNSLDSGDLIAGGSKSGKVCWEDPGQSGQYVVIWKPDAFNADRGIWLVTL